MLRPSPRRLLRRPAHPVRGTAYVGSVGTGFKERDVLQLRIRMDKITRKTPPLPYTGARKNVVWMQPTVIAEIEYRGWTDDSKLRHASYKGVRDVQDNAAIYEVD
ncbi:ATP-dependent DNA ligase [Rhizobium laguerreae]|uniref:ATP dependent DNA ligase n=1 Tax=Rhizobium laguerreae TaxID=1076926 RepID=UPI001C9221CD|nr:ATP-dependent DNA ligase [Rhizobium laguerreae]